MGKNNRTTDRIRLRDLVHLQQIDTEMDEWEEARNYPDYGILNRRMDADIWEEIDRILKKQGINACKNCSSTQALIEVGYNCRLYRYWGSQCGEAGLKIKSEGNCDYEKEVEIQTIDGGKILRKFKASW